MAASFSHALRVRSSIASMGMGIGRRPLITHLPNKRVHAHLPPSQQATARGILPIHIGRSNQKPTNQVFGCAMNTESLYGPMRSTDLAFITVWTSSPAPESWATVERVRDLIFKDRVGEEEGGVAFMEVALDAPDLANDQVGLSYGVDKVPTLLAFDPRWTMPFDDEARVTDPSKLEDVEFLRGYIRHYARAGKYYRDYDDSKK